MPDDAPQERRPERGLRSPRLREWRRRAAILAGLAGLAITQPVLDLFGANPEFFVAGRYSGFQIVVFALVVAFVPAVAAIAASAAAEVAHPVAGAVVYVAAVAAFSFLFGLVVLNAVEVDQAWLAFLAAGALAGVVVWLERTRPLMRSALSYLALGNVAFLFLFLFASPTAELVGGSASAGEFGEVRVSRPKGPVVFVILDELPVTTLMRPDGTINDDRYPNFARLAGSSTWFRNASSHSPMTSVSVPSMLSGTLPEAGDLPTYHDHPRNYFSLFGDEYTINRYESVTDLCPPSACEPGPRGSVQDALRDSSIVYGHQVLPGGFADGLPSIDHSWGNFGDDLGPTGLDASASSAPAIGGSPSPGAADLGNDAYGQWHNLDPSDRSALGQFNALEQAVSVIDAAPSVNFVHVALPHYPWTLTPWGTRLTQFPNDLTNDPDDPAYDRSAVLRYQLHSLQVGAADVAVGRLIDHLQRVGAWRDALVVVTSDHGNGLLPPDFGRKLTDENREELLRIPLFIKAPGQQAGEVRDDVAQTIDILPSVIDLLGASTDWTFDGHSLFDGSQPDTDPDVDESLQPALDIAARHAADFVGVDDWIGLAAVGENGDLVGTPVADMAVSSPSELRWSLTDADLLDDLPTPDGQVPYLLTGSIAGDERPPELMVAVNGTIAGVVGPTDQGDGGWRFLGLMGPFFRDGSNTVEAYEVDRSGPTPVLHLVGES